MTATCEHYKQSMMQACCLDCRPVPSSLHRAVLEGRDRWAAEAYRMKADRNRLDDILNAVREALGVPEGEDIIRFAENIKKAPCARTPMTLHVRHDLTERVEDIDARLKKLENMTRRYG